MLEKQETVLTPTPHTFSVATGNSNHSSEQCCRTVQEVQVSPDEEPSQYVPSTPRPVLLGGVLSFLSLLFLCSGSDGRGVLLCQGLYQSSEVSQVCCLFSQVLIALQCSWNRRLHCRICHYCAYFYLIPVMRYLLKCPLLHNWLSF